MLPGQHEHVKAQQYPCSCLFVSLANYMYISTTYSRTPNPSQSLSSTNISLQQFLTLLSPPTPHNPSPLHVSLIAFLSPIRQPLTNPLLPPLTVAPSLQFTLHTRLSLSLSPSTPSNTRRLLTTSAGLKDRYGVIGMVIRRSGDSTSSHEASSVQPSARRSNTCASGGEGGRIWLCKAAIQILYTNKTQKD